MKQDFEKGKQRKTKMRYMPGLDGLRAIAVLGIIIYHLNRKWLTGGFIGVDTFFVISGYLITSLLLKEYEERLLALNNSGFDELKGYFQQLLRY